MKIKDIAKIVKKGETIAILGHISPDMDCFGSVFSLKLSLESLGKTVDAFTDGELNEKAKKIFSGETLSTEFDYRNYDLLIIVDTPNKQRLGRYGEEVIKHKNIIKLDHHKEIENSFSKQEYVDSLSSSCSEICYLLIKELNIEMDQKIATYLYAGLSADTNSFVNTNVNINSFNMAKILCEAGANTLLVNEVMFKSKTLEEWMLDKKIYETTEIHKNYGISIIRYKDISKLKGDKEGMSRYANKIVSLDCMLIGCSMTERNKNTYDCSFRSKKEVAVNEVAKKFGGGGHLNAAGCVVTGSLKDAKRKVEKAIKETLKEQGFND